MSYYSFSPIPAVTPEHGGFVIICVFIFILLVICAFAEPEEFLLYFLIATVVVAFSYGVSYVFTDQEVKPYANEQVTAELVGFQPEGYNERSGKSRADRHYMYVVYKVNGEKVILRAREGVTYPPIAILYKN